MPAAYTRVEVQVQEVPRGWRQDGSDPVSHHHTDPACLLVGCQVCSGLSHASLSGSERVGVDVPSTSEMVTWPGSQELRAEVPEKHSTGDYEGDMAVGSL